jgi:uncharacterized protein (DUF4213/DUF364 family)
MKIIDYLLSTLNFDTTVKDIRLGIFQTAVLTRNGGLAGTLPFDVLRQTSILTKEPGSLLDKTPEELARMALSESLLEAVIGMATINSLLETDGVSGMELNAGDLIMKKGEGKRVAIVGHFPFTPKVREKAKELWVIEKNPKEGDSNEASAKKLIPQADLVAITGTSLTNHTIENLLSLCDPAAFVILIGDTAPLSPALFEFGIDAISGTRVVDPELTLRYVSQGASFRQIKKGIRLLTLLKDGRI